MKRTVSTGVIQLLPDDRPGSMFSTRTHVQWELSAACRSLCCWYKTKDSPGMGISWSSVCMPDASVHRGPWPRGACIDETLFCSEHSTHTQQRGAGSAQSSTGCKWRSSAPGTRRSTRGSRQFVAAAHTGGASAREGSRFCVLCSPGWPGQAGVWPSPSRCCPGHGPSDFLRCGATHHAASSRQRLRSRVPYALLSVLHKESALQARCSGAFRVMPIVVRCRFLYARRKAPATVSFQPDRQRRFPYVSQSYE
jgi:hypothetical protein